MTPSNTALTPEIMNIADNQGNKHTVVPTLHQHSQDEIDGLVDALAGKAATVHKHTSIGYEENTKSAFVITSEDTVSIEVQNEERGGECEITPSNIDNLFRALSNPDTVPTLNSNNLVTSGGVKTALARKMDTKQIDPQPANNVDHLVTSKGVYDALVRKSDKVPQIKLHIESEDHINMDSPTSLIDVLDFQGAFNNLPIPVELVLYKQTIEGEAKIIYPTSLSLIFVDLESGQFVVDFYFAGNIYEVSGTADDFQQPTEVVLDDEFFIKKDSIWNV